MQSKKRYLWRQGSYHERKGRSQEIGHDRNLSEMRNKDVQNYGQGQVENSAVFYKTKSPRHIRVRGLLFYSIMKKRN